MANFRNLFRSSFITATLLQVIFFSGGIREARAETTNTISDFLRGFIQRFFGQSTEYQWSLRLDEGWLYLSPGTDSAKEITSASFSVFADGQFSVYESTRLDQGVARIWIGPLYQPGQKIVVRLGEHLRNGSLFNDGIRIVGELALPDASAFQVSQMGSSRNQFPIDVRFDGLVFRAETPLDSMPSESERKNVYYVIEHRFAPDTRPDEQNTLNALAVPLNYPISISRVRSAGGLRDSHAWGAGGNGKIDSQVILVATPDVLAKAWSPEENRVRYCETSAAVDTPSNKIFSLASTPAGCDQPGLKQAGMNRFPPHVRSPAGTMAQMVTPNFWTDIGSGTADERVRSASDDIVRAKATQFREHGLVMFDFEHNSNRYAANGTGGKFALLADEIRRLNPSALVMDWYQGGLPGLRSAIRPLDLKPFFSESFRGEASPFFQGLRDVSRYTGQVMGLNPELLEKYDSVGGKRYIDTLQALNVPAYATSFEGTDDSGTNPYISEIIFASRLGKTYFPDKKSLCVGWHLVEAFPGDPWVTWAMESGDERLEQPGRVVESYSYSRDKTLWCMLEGDGFYNWDGRATYGYGRASPSMYDYALSFRYYVPNENAYRWYDELLYNGTPLGKPEDGFPGFGWSKSDPSRKNFRSMYPEHPQDAMVGAARDISSLKDYVQTGVHEDLPAAYSEKQLENIHAQVDGSQILESLQQGLPFVTSFRVGNRSLVALHDSRLAFGERRIVYIRRGNQTIRLTATGQLTSLHEVEWR